MKSGRCDVVSLCPLCARVSVGVLGCSPGLRNPRWARRPRKHPLSHNRNSLFCRHDFLTKNKLQRSQKKRERKKWTGWGEGQPKRGKKSYGGEKRRNLKFNIRRRISVTRRILDRKSSLDHPFKQIQDYLNYLLVHFFRLSSF